MTLRSGMTVHPAAEAPPRPTAVKVAVPVFAATWALLIGVSIQFAPDDAGGLAAHLGMATFWSLVWNFALYRVWRGGPLAIQTVSLLAMIISGMSLVAFVLIGVMIGDSVGDGLYRDLPMPFWLIIAAYVCVLATGIGLRRPAVLEWSYAVNPPRSRAEAAIRTGPGGAAGDSAAVVPEASNDDDARAASAASLTLDLGQKLVAQARVRIGCFGVILGIFVVIGLVAGIPVLVREGDWTAISSIGGFVVIFALALVVSVRRFRKRLGPGSTLTIDRRGITWQNGVEQAAISWNAMAGVGISYHMVSTKSGRKMHMPQLDIFEQVSSPAGRWPAFDTRLRQEAPPRPGLPRQRYRLMLPTMDRVHTEIEAAITTHRPALWLGWYERARSDTPWFLR
jgi:hypothetical protein